MDKDFVSRMKGKLTKMKKEILKHLASENEDFKNIIDDIDPKDLVDIAAEDIDKKILQVLGTQEMKRLQLIDSALARIENGKYGICMSCGKKIPKERLEAIPYALLCVECKAKEERKKR